MQEIYPLIARAGRRELARGCAWATGGRESPRDMPEYAATVETPKSPADAFAYMAEFSHTSEWDPNCERAERTTEGELGVGSRFELEFSGVAGQTMQLQYEITEYDAPRKVVLTGGNDSLKSVDTIEVEPSGDGAAVTYTAQLSLTGIKQLATPILAMGLQKAGSDARKGLEEKLGR
jgi:uncharacterized protein YndB with AHSA1/START domain